MKLILQQKMHSFLLSSLMICLALGNFSPLPPLPDWNIVYDAIIAKDLAKIEQIVREVIEGPWQCKNKYAYLQCLYGRLNSYNLASVLPFETVPLEVESLEEEQELVKNINSLIIEERLALNQTGQFQKYLQKVGQFLLQEQNPAAIQKKIDEIIFKTNQEFPNIITIEFEKTMRMDEDQIFSRRVQVDETNKIINLNKKQIKSIELRNSAIDEEIAILIQEKTLNENQMGSLSQEIFQLEEMIFSLGNLDDSLRRAQDLAQFVKSNLEARNQALSDSLKEQRAILRSVAKAVGPVLGIEQIFVLIETSQFKCYAAAANNVEYKDAAVHSFFTRKHLNYYIHKAFGSGAYETIKNYLTDQPYQIELLNIFEENWVQEYGDTLLESAYDPLCCHIDVFNFRTGKILWIFNNDVMVEFITGEQMLITINVCSRIYRLTPEYNRILFIAEPFGTLNKVRLALLFGK